MGTTYRITDLPPELAGRITVHPETGCWIWEHKSGPNPDRYGYVLWDGRYEGIHRAVYRILVGPIPDDRPTLDHVYTWGCRYRACCWPEHLEPVTKAENSSRGCFANRGKGVAKTVLKRVAAGTASGNDLTLAAWHEVEQRAS